MKAKEISVIISYLLLSFSSLVIFTNNTEGNLISNTAVTAEVKFKLLAGRPA